MSKVTIKDAGWKRISENFKRLNGRVRVGVLASRGGTAVHPKAGISMVALAAIHEFGTKNSPSPHANTPERSFIRRTFLPAKYSRAQDVAHRMAAFCSPLAAGVLLGKIDPVRALSALGAWGVAEVQKTITSGPSIPPRLAAATIRRKHSSRALVDTGRLLQSLQWEVVTGPAVES